MVVGGWCLVLLLSLQVVAELVVAAVCCYAGESIAAAAVVVMNVGSWRVEYFQFHQPTDESKKILDLTIRWRWFNADVSLYHNNFYLTRVLFSVDVSQLEIQRPHGFLENFLGLFDLFLRALLYSTTYDRQNASSESVSRARITVEKETTLILYRRVEFTVRSTVLNIA